jgi:hypothetical protein
LITCFSVIWLTRSIIYWYLFGPVLLEPMRMWVHWIYIVFPSSSFTTSYNIVFHFPSALPNKYRIEYYQTVFQLQRSKVQFLSLHYLRKRMHWRELWQAQREVD